MSRTHLIDGHVQFNSDVHTQANAVERAMREGNIVTSDGKLVTSFSFDLLEFAKNIQVKRLKDGVFGRLMFTIDGYIQGALSSLLNDYYRHSREEPGAPTFKTYSDFLAHIEGMTASEQSLYETGMDVQPSVERIRNLVQFRNEVHNVIAGDPDLVRCRWEKVVDGVYQPSTVRDVLASPRMRQLTRANEADLKAICEDDYPDDEAMRTELFAQYKLDTHLKNVSDFKFAKDKSESLIVLWSCIGADDQADVSEDDDAFWNMDARTQAGLLRTTLNVIRDTRKDAVLDNRLSTNEKAALRVEAKALIPAIEAAMEHEKFQSTLN